MKRDALQLRNYSTGQFPSLIHEPWSAASCNFPLPLLEDLVAVRSCMAKRHSQALPQNFGAWLCLVGESSRSARGSIHLSGRVLLKTLPVAHGLIQENRAKYI